MGARYARPVPRDHYSVSDAAKALGISIDTLRRWDRAGRIATERDSANRRIVAASEIDRLRGEPGAAAMSARNRLRGVVTDVRVEGLMAQVELVVSEPVRLVAIVTRDAVDELGLKRGDRATALVKSTSMMIQI
jgi:molybdopterin-binding protein